MCRETPSSVPLKSLDRASILARAATHVLRQNSLLGFMILVLLAAAFCIFVGTALGFENFTDVGYPDSATLLRINDVVRSGHIYPDFNRPPYLVTIYGPLTYVLLSVPYRQALAMGIAPEVPVRLCVFAAFCLCVFLIFLISRQVNGTGGIAGLCALFAMSALPIARWTTQVRGDFLALAFALLSVYLLLIAKDRRLSTASAICAGIAPLIKLTFLAVPAAITGWLIYRRRFKEAALWSTCFAFTVIGGYAFFGWREPLMLQHIAALRHPVLEYRKALGILWFAMSQPVVPFAVIGGFLALRKHTPEKLLVLGYSLVAWLVGLLTIPQVGGSINYFWEPLLVSSVLAGPGLLGLQRKANRSPIVVGVALFILLLKSFAPDLRNDLNYLKECHAEVKDHRADKAKWEAFLSVISGRRLLSDVPAVTIQSAIPEMPDPYLNSTLELHGKWNSRPVVAEIDAGVFELIVIGKPDTGTPGRYRGVPYWSDTISQAIDRAYAPACVFEQMEVWLPRQGANAILPRLSAIGCRPAPK